MENNIENNNLNNNITMEMIQILKGRYISKLIDLLNIKQQ